VLLLFELLEKPYECYYVIALPINITFILALCGHWLEVPKDCEAFFGEARLNYLAILYLELFGNPPISKFGEQRREEMRLPCGWAVAKTLKMCWPEWNTHFTSGIHSFKPISMICQHSSSDLKLKLQRKYYRTYRIVSVSPDKSAEMTIFSLSILAGAPFGLVVLSHLTVSRATAFAKRSIEWDFTKQE